MSGIQVQVDNFQVWPLVLEPYYEMVLGFVGKVADIPGPWAVGGLGVGHRNLLVLLELK